MRVKPKRRPDPKGRPTLEVESDSDYVGCFQDLFSVGVQLRKGRTVPLLLQAAVLNLRLGNHGAARFEAQNALKLNAACVEAHWLRALACLGLTLERLGLIDAGPGAIADDDPKLPAEETLEEAHASFTQCARLTNWQDQEAVDYMEFLSTLLAARLTGAALARALRPLLDRPTTSTSRRLEPGRSHGR